ncbi:MAG: RNA methyltransferase [Alphaproteobacteria bacterium]|nr:RNA methyltransferase [Alphaproteobacteria bacterium]
MIESPQNETFKRLLSLTTSKGLKEEGQFLLSGEKLVREFLKNPALKIAAELPAPRAKPLTEAKPIDLNFQLFAQIDVLGTRFNILVLEQPPLPTLTAADLRTYKPNGIELAAPTGDPGNLGALIRSAEAFGLTRVILSKEAAHPFLPKAVKASAGSVLRLPLAKGPMLAEFPSTCIALDMQGVPLDDFVWPKNGILVVGEEGPGLNGAKFDTVLRIPTKGVESLNAVVAASIAMSRIPPKTP